MDFQLTSKAFDVRGGIPQKYTADGLGDYSPPLEWRNAPPGAQTFALILEDLDAVLYPRTHWLLYNIRCCFRRLPEAVPALETIHKVADHGTNDFGKVGYQGPHTSHRSIHHYLFTLYALDCWLELTPQAFRADLLKAMEEHVLDRAELVGTYPGQGINTPVRKR